MRITTLIENTSCGDGFASEHGISLLIETGKHIILFDAGQSDAFARNAEKLGVDLRDVDFAVLSHGHYDHGGGLTRFLEINEKAPVYVNCHAFEEHFHGADRYIGLDCRLKESGRILFAGDECRVDEGITLYSGNGRETVTPVDSSGLCVKKDGVLCPEDFCHEQYMLVEEDGMRCLFSGCSHRGILNIMHWFAPDVLVGGFHFKDIALDDAGRERLRKAADVLLGYRTVYYTGHCTGMEQYRFLKELMGDALHYISAGSVISLE